MATQVQNRRGSTAEHSTFTGANGELTVDTTKKTVVVHDGTTAGGVPLLRENGSQNAVTTGTSTAASFIPTSSTVPTNGVYLPSANNVAISTNGTGRLFVDASGNVGVGNNPGFAVGSGLEIERDSATATLRIQRTNTGASALELRADNLFTVIDSRLAGQDLLFQTNATERLRITSAGFVGIGTSSPSQLFHVNGNAVVGGSPATRYSAFTVAGDVALQSATPLLNLVNAAGSTRFGYIYHNGTGGNIDILNQENGGLTFGTNNTERARIESSGRLLVGTSSGNAEFHFRRTGATNATMLLDCETGVNYFIQTRYASDISGAQHQFRKYRGSIASSSAVSSGDFIGTTQYYGYDGTNLIEAASISAIVDGTPGANDMPGRIVLSTTLDGASSPTEALRITNDRVVAYNQPAPTSKSAAATLTVAELKTGIIQYTGSAATLTLPTGTLTEGGFAGIYTNMTFEWSVINTGSGTCTIGAGTDHTIVGGATVAAGASGRFASRRTAANTFVSYRLS